MSSVSVPKKNIPKKNTSRNLVYSYFANFANLHFYWQLNSVIAITFSCIDSIDCSPFSRNEPGENVVKLHLHNWNIQFEIWYNIFDKCSQCLWCTVIFIDLSQICVVESWTASRQLLGNFISTIAFVYEGQGICLFGPSRALLAITSCLTSRAGKHLSGLLRLH
jgi:hypothetical protein